MLDSYHSNVALLTWHRQNCCKVLVISPQRNQAQFARNHLICDQSHFSKLSLELPAGLIVKYVYLLAVVAFCVSCAQTENTSYPVNTGYTLESAFKKLSDKKPETSWPDPVANIVVQKAQVHKKVGTRWLKADVYRSASQEGLRPAIILVHGGGWATGIKGMWFALAERLAAQNYVAVTVDYRLSPEAKYPAAVQDIRDAIYWLRANAKHYGVDKHNIVLAGGSAGGQLASLVGLTAGNLVLDQYAPKRSSNARVKAVVNIDGLSSFVVPMALKHENAPHKNPSAAGAWLGGAYQAIPETWEQASPLNYVSNITPPMLFFKGEAARFTAGIEQMSAKLRELNIPFRVESFPDAPHSFWLFDPWVSPTAEKITAFLSSIGVH